MSVIGRLNVAPLASVPSSKEVGIVEWVPARIVIVCPVEPKLLQRESAVCPTVVVNAESTATLIAHMLPTTPAMLTRDVASIVASVCVKMLAWTIVALAVLKLSLSEGETLVIADKVPTLTADEPSELLANVAVLVEPNG